MLYMKPAQPEDGATSREMDLHKQIAALRTLVARREAKIETLQNDLTAKDKQLFDLLASVDARRDA